MSENNVQEQDFASQLQMLEILNLPSTGFGASNEDEEFTQQIESIKASQTKQTRKDDVVIENTDNEASIDEVTEQEGLSLNEQETTDVEDDEFKDIEDPFGVLKTKSKKNKVKIDFEPQKELLELIDKKYSIKDLPTFLNSVDTFRKQAEEGTKATELLQLVQQDLNSMPPDLAHSVDLWRNGQDHTKAFTNRLDFSKEFEKQNLEGLVEKYLPEEYKEEKERLENEEISPEEFERSIKLLRSTTKRLFEKDKELLDDQRVQYEKQQKEKFENIEKSAVDSVKNLSENYQNFSESEKLKIQNILVNGAADDLFYEADGTYKKDVAEKIAFVLYGKKMLESAKKIAERRGESRAREEVIDMSDKNVKTSRQNNNSTSVPDEVLKAYSHILLPEKKSPFAINNK